MQFHFNKLFRSPSKQKFVVGMEELGRIFQGGTTGSWSKTNQLRQYSKSLYVFAAVNKIATKVSDVDLELHQITSAKGENSEIMNHEILDLMTKVNSFQTRSEFLKTAWINKKVTGEAFWLKIRNNEGKVVELWNLRPDLMTVVSDPVKYVKHYELDKEDGEKEIFDVEDVIHFKDPDPLNPFRGLSPLVSSKSRIETEEGATIYQRDFFKNNARPDALLVTEQQLDGDQRTQMVSAWEERHMGDDNAAKIGILEGGMKYQQVSISQREMDYIESMKFTRDDILVALGVPKSVMTTDDTSYANAETGLRMFLSETIIPELRQLCEVLNTYLIIPDFGEQYFLDFVNPTPSDRESLRHDSVAAHGKWATINEIRAMNDLPPIDGGDVIAETQSQGGFQTGSPDGQTSDSGTKQISQLLPMSEVSYRKTEEMRKKALKLLQGRPSLRRKFELHDSFATEIKNSILSAKKILKNKKNVTKNVKEDSSATMGSMFSDDVIRITYHDLVNKRIDKRKLSFEKELEKQFAQQEMRVLANLETIESESKGFYQKLSSSAVNRIMNKDAEKQIFSTFALPFLVEYAQEGGSDSATFVGEDFNMTEQLTRSMEKRSLFFADSVVDTTFQSLVRTLTEGTNAGEGIDSLKQRVREIYIDVPEHRAAMIARTETTNANNEGILEQFRLSDIVKGKEWIAVMDNVTRDEHAKLNGEIKGIDEVFSNGLTHPNEPNCRCVIGPALYKKSFSATTQKKNKEIAGLDTKGGAGSGNHGHDGRPGQTGGSKPGEGVAISPERIQGIAYATRIGADSTYLNMPARELLAAENQKILDTADDASLVASYNMMYANDYRNLSMETTVQLGEFLKGKTELSDSDCIEIVSIVKKYGPAGGFPGVVPLTENNFRPSWDTTALYASRIRDINVAKDMLVTNVQFDGRQSYYAFSNFGKTPEIRQMARSHGESIGYKDNLTPSFASQSAFESRFVAVWTPSSNMPEQVEYKLAARELWGGNSKGIIFHEKGTLGEIVADPRVMDSMSAMYNNTQSILNSSKKQSTTLYRGVSREVVAHSAIESWSASKGSAKKFDGHGVMEMDVPNSKVLFTYKTLADWPEKEVKGKKEYGLLGGLLDNEN